MTIVALVLLVALAADAKHEAPVGRAGRIEEIVLPGSELLPLPADARSKVVVRVLAAYPHGSAFRYDLEFTGLEPGEYDLRSFLVRKDASPIAPADLPPIPVTIRSVLPPGQLLPHALEPSAAPRVGGYRVLLIVAGALWLAGFVAILVYRRKRTDHAGDASTQPTSLADRLKPLIERAVAGSLGDAECARLEIALVTLWQKRLGLEARTPADALKTLRAHAEAGPLLTGLETWLHRPPPHPPVDVAALLAPYRNLSPDALDVAPRARAASRS